MATPSLPDYASNTGVVRHVSVTQKLASGTEIADITVNGAKTTIYAPNSTGPSSTTVVVTPELTTGTKIGSIKVNSTSKDLFVPSAGFLLADDGNTRKVRSNIQDSAIPASTGTAIPLGIKKDANGNPQLVQSPTTSQSKTTGTQSKTTGSQSKVSEIWQFETVGGDIEEKTIITSVTLEPSVIKDVSLQATVVTEVTVASKVVTGV